MMHPRRSTVTLWLLGFLLLSTWNCQLPGFDFEPTATPISHPTDSTTLVLRVETSHQLVSPSSRALSLATQLPEFSLYGDGTIITIGPQILIYPPPALPNLLQSRITKDGIQRILQEATQAGLLAGDAHYPLAGTLGAPTTVFTVNASGRTSRVSVYALGLDDPSDPQLSPEERAARQRLGDFRAKVLDFLHWLPPEAIVEQEQPYVITRLQLVTLPAEVDPRVRPDEPELAVPRPWPLPTPLSQVGDPALWLHTAARCTVVESRKELPHLLEALQTATTLTPWESEGKLYTLLVRPLLPDEEGCKH